MPSRAGVDGEADAAVRADYTRTKQCLPRASWPVMRWGTNAVMCSLTGGDISD
jgi:hypothetical protein